MAGRRLLIIAGRAIKWRRVQAAIRVAGVADVGIWDAHKFYLKGLIIRKRITRDTHSADRASTRVSGKSLPLTHDEIIVHRDERTNQRRVFCMCETSAKRENYNLAADVAFRAENCHF